MTYQDTWKYHYDAKRLSYPAWRTDTGKGIFHPTSPVKVNTPPKARK